MGLRTEIIKGIRGLFGNNEKFKTRTIKKLYIPKMIILKYIKDIYREKYKVWSMRSS